MFRGAPRIVGQGEIELTFILSLSLAYALSPEWSTGEGEAYDSVIELTLGKRKKWVEARSKAVSLLKQNPQSLAAHYVMGRALFVGYGQHAKAMHHFEQALNIYEDTQRGRSDEPWLLETNIFFSMQYLAGDMGDYGRQLELISLFNDTIKNHKRRFNSRISPMIGERGWPLMKLERYQEAKVAALSAIDTDDVWQQSLGHNVLCAVESELGNRIPSLERCEDALNHARKTDSDVAIDAANAAVSARAVLDYEKMERYLIEGTKSKGLSAPAWMYLVDLYLLQGRGTSAIDAMKGLRKAQLADPPHLRTQRLADINVRFATILLLAGETEKGLDVIERVLLQPDRRGKVTFSEEQTKGTHLLLQLLLKRVHGQRLQEKRSALPLLSRSHGAVLNAFSSMLDMGDELGIRNTLKDEKRLLATFRIYMDKGLTDFHSFFMGDLIAVVGPGPAQAALNRVKKIERFSQMTAFHDSISADIAFVKGDVAGVETHGKQALTSLPLAESMLRARMLMLLAWADNENGKQELALKRYMEAYQLDPSIFRRLNVRIPVRIRSESDGFGMDIAAALGRSPRFLSSDEGFLIDIQGTSPNLRVCFIGPYGESLHCMLAPGSEKKKIMEDEKGEAIEQVVQLNKTEWLQEIVDSFHQQVFGLPMGVFGLEWNTLDGSTNSSRQATQDQIKDLLSQ